MHLKHGSTGNGAYAWKETMSRVMVASKLVFDQMAFCIHACIHPTEAYCSLGLIFNPEDGGSTFL
jgi:hypothetical protein